MSVKLINAVGGSKTLPVTVSWLRDSLEVLVPLAELVDRPGAVRTGRPRLRPRRFRLEGSIYLPDPDNIVEEIDQLLALLAHPPIQVYPVDEEERFVFAWPQGSERDWIDARRELRLQVPMIAPDPFYYGNEVEETETADSDDHDWSIDVKGTAPVHPRITIIVNADGGCEDITITQINTGDVVKLFGEFVPSDVIVVDTERFTVTLNGDEALDLAHNDWLLGGFALWPGTNPLNFAAASGTPDVDVKLTYRPRWY